MRTQSLFYSRFWLGGSGNEIRKNGSDAIVTAIYLATCPGSHMSGIYYCPIPIIADETMISETRVKKVLIILENLNFIKYDHDSKVVWVTTMGEYQGNITNKNDKKYKSIITHISRFLIAF